VTEGELAGGLEGQLGWKGSPFFVGGGAKQVFYGEGRSMPDDAKIHFDSVFLGKEGKVDTSRKVDSTSRLTVSTPVGEYGINLGAVSRILRSLFIGVPMTAMGGTATLRYGTGQSMKPITPADIATGKAPMPMNCTKENPCLNSGR
jgi:hypothetical protein